MDDNASVSISKRRKLFKGCEIYDLGKDRITDLPDDILSRILSFLPTVYAVRTSVLSRRWENLWASTLCIDIHDHLLSDRRTVQQTKRFMNFVEKVLLLHETTCIHKFCLSWSWRTLLDPSRVNVWVASVLRRKVREIDLNIYVDLPFVFPRTIFTCESLAVLNITNCDLKIPKSSVFPSLKVLSINVLEISCDAEIQEVSFSCPSLRELEIFECQWERIKTFNISTPALRTLKVSDYSSIDDGCKIKIHAKNLRFLKLTSTMSCELYLDNPSSVIVASIDVFDKEIDSCTSGLLRGICNTNHLTLSDLSIMAISNANLTAIFATFSHLKHLGVFIENDTLTLKHLTELLFYMQNVESLLFIHGFDNCPVEEHDWAFASAPNSILSHLKLLELSSFAGSKNELDIIEFFLKITKTLSKLIIKSSPVLLEDPKKHLEVAEKVSLLARGTECCTIAFS
ncbi:hypothetical protein ACHQM5_003727 [Ranunculus cassubicifolius]